MKLRHTLLLHFSQTGNSIFYQILYCDDVLTTDFIRYIYNLLQVVQEYERAVIFRLGRLKQGGAQVQNKLIQYALNDYDISTINAVLKGSWNIFCDSLHWPFQVCRLENCLIWCSSPGGEPERCYYLLIWFPPSSDPDTRLCDSQCGRCGLLQCHWCRACSVQCWRLQVCWQKSDQMIRDIVIPSSGSPLIIIG